jgi:hypothetical protein
MALFGLIRAAALAVPAVLAGTGVMAQHVTIVPPAMVLVLSPSGATAVESPARPVALERFIADQEAMMDRMFADMDAMFAGFPTAMRPMTIAAAPGAGAVVCQESISVTYGGGNAKPLVRVSHAGNGCAPSAGTPLSVPAETLPTAPAPEHPQILNVSEPIRVAPALRHRT